MDFNNKYKNNLDLLYKNRQVDFEIFFLDLIRYLKYFKIIYVNKKTKILFKNHTFKNLTIPKVLSGH